MWHWSCPASNKKISKQAKKSENMFYNQMEKAIFIKKNQEVIEMVDLAKNIKIAIMIHIFEKVGENVTKMRRKMEAFEVLDPNEISRNEKYNVWNENTQNVIKTRLDFEEGEISEFETVALETIQNETYASHMIQKSHS